MSDKQCQQGDAQELTRLMEAAHLYLWFPDEQSDSYPYTCRETPSPDNAIFAYHNFPNFKMVHNRILFTKEGIVLGWSKDEHHTLGIRQPVKIGDTLWCRKTTIYEVLLASVLRIIERETLLNIDLCRISPFVTFLVHPDEVTFLWVCESEKGVECATLGEGTDVNELLKNPAVSFDPESEFILSSVLKIKPAVD